MRNLRGTYVHRGDRARRRRRIRRVLLATVLVSASGFEVFHRKADIASAAPVTVSTRAPYFASSVVTPAAKFVRPKFGIGIGSGKRQLMATQIDRVQRIMELSHAYDISAGLATSIFDAAVKERIDPDLAFRLIRLESDFHPGAVSSAGAVGLTQLMPSTAVQFERWITPSELTERSTNLRIGFRYLRSLLNLYHGNIRLALLAYNRGEDAVGRDLKKGVDPGNGYDRWVIGSYKGRGTIDGAE